MSNFQINFLYSPWLLLLIIPALVLTFFPYFRTPKKYRRTRNRIISVILHSIIVLLTFSVLAGMYFSYDMRNDENELIVLVDVSFSGEEVADSRDNFVRSVLDESRGEYRVGIVLFGFDQVLAAEPSYNMDEVYAGYLNAPLPDVTATNIAGALNFARNIFRYPESGKIILISDGLETDSEAMSVIRSIAASGIIVDTTCISAKRGNEIEIVSVELPQKNITVGDPVEMTFTLASSVSGGASITLYDTSDGNVLEETLDVNLKIGTQTGIFSHIFETPGVHELRFVVNGSGDTLSENNTYYTFFNLKVFDRVLILERYTDESSKLNGILDKKINEETNNFDTDVVNIMDLDKIPATLDALREYDQVILLNIARSDMPAGFEDMLYDYVSVYGGGLLTVGGNELDASGQVVKDIYDNPVAHAYDREDLVDSKLQEMLPVQAIDYTPPVATVIIIDRSGSMKLETSIGVSRLELAKTGARACLRAMSDRDWCSVMTLENDYETQLAMTPLTQRSRIEAAIESISIGEDGGGGTMFAPALSRAFEALSTLRSVERKHVILVTDGMPYDQLDDGNNPFGPIIDFYNKNYGITLSIAAISITSEYTDMMEETARRGGGRFYAVSDALIETLPDLMMQELTMPEIKAVIYEPYQPRINQRTSVVNGIEQENIPKLLGFYGTKAKTSTNENNLAIPLMGEYVPVYAQWTFGKGTVGSFMCDLSGYWSEEFMGSDTGMLFINNVVTAIMPTTDISMQEIDTTLIEDNYTTHVSIYTTLEKGERIEARIISPPVDGATLPTEQTILPSSTDGYSRFSFVIKDPGLHQIEIVKVSEDGTVIASFGTYRPFSYSREYDVFRSAEEGRELLEQLSENSNGKLVTNAAEVYETFANRLHKELDLRLPFIIAVLLLFLLDLAVRKFKFKWPHEIIRDRKTKKELAKN